MQTAMEKTVVAQPVPAHAPKTLSILGASGSIGQSTLDLVQRNPDRFAVVALTANTNAEALADAALKVRPRIVAVADDRAYPALAERLAGTGVTVLAGADGVVAAASEPVDILVSAIVGAAGLPPSLAAIGKAGAIALANKECLVCAGDLFMRAAAAAGTRVLPVDSEHNAIFQALDPDNLDGVAEIILTASGGPFREMPREAMARVTLAEALRHPRWVMGAKITIDSATLMNKGLELIEAHHLFGFSPDRLSVLVHPQSVVHGLVRYVDGSLLAQLGSPDMRTPIAHCLAWPERMAVPVQPLDLARLGTLTFEEPDRDRFPCLALAEQALRRGGAATNVLNAANEVAVGAFLGERIGYLDIAAVVEETLSACEGQGLLSRLASVEAAIVLDREARRHAAERVVAWQGAH
nr:1-deoxy-D-xylulose-5-phosphate reductoisomerase [Hartmannibacter diazotrophicus]